MLSRARNSASLPHAIRLPENVTAPISPDSAVATSSGVPAFFNCISAAPATSVEAIPPKPLNNATI